jgi:hypothetical protein
MTVEFCFVISVTHLNKLSTGKDNDDENVQLCISTKNVFKLDIKHFQLHCCNLYEGHKWK